MSPSCRTPPTKAQNSLLLLCDVLNSLVPFLTWQIRTYILLLPKSNCISFVELTLYIRLQATKRIIEGFETPYGLELLATTDWIMKRHPDASVDVKRAIDLFRAWNERKKKVFKESHILTAWRHLTGVN